MTTPSHETTKKRSKHAEIASLFIQKSYEVLEDQKFTDIVDWNAEGTALVIKKPLEFGQIVLPTYFKHNNLTSFVRQLNMYDFHKRRTQAYDHVYYHDLFQRGKKHLLREIKRKNQENTLVNIQRAIEALEHVQNGQKNESVTNAYENQLLKKLNKDALGKIAALENKVKELNDQNQNLWTRINHQNKKEDVLVSFMAGFMKKRGITLDKLPEVLSHQFSLPNMESVAQEQPHEANRMVNHSNMGDYLNFNDNMSGSTEISPASLSSENQSDYMRADVHDNISRQPEIPINEDDYMRFQSGYSSVLEKRGFEGRKNEYETRVKMVKRETVKGVLELKVPGRININISRAGLQEVKQSYLPVDTFQEPSFMPHDRLDFSNFD